MKKYNVVVTGGSFDLFHKGHEAFLKEQFALSEKVLIGLTSDAYIHQHKGDGNEDFQTRLHNLHTFVVSQNKEHDIEIVEIHDAYIPSVWNTYPIEAIVVTKDTKKGAEIINTKRKKEGKKVLPIEIINEIVAEDGKVISSSRIRNGEIDREGKVYISAEWLTHMLLLPEKVRHELQKPWGREFPSISAWVQEKNHEKAFLISVGDMVTKTLYEYGIRPNIVVVDLHVQRKPFFSSLEQHKLDGYTTISVNNPAGSISPELFMTAKANIHKKKIALLIIGEEDLTVLPFVLAAPLGYTIVYGQPNRGIVVIEVTEEKKNHIKNIVKKFNLSASK